MRIQPINDSEGTGNKFCGPAVISAIAGITTDEAEKMIQDIRVKNHTRNALGRVTGVYAAEIRDVFQKLGWKVYDIHGVSGRSIYFLMTTMSTPGVYVFMVPGHFVAIEIADDGKRYIVDTYTKSPIKLTVSARLMQKVQAVIKLEKQ